MDHTMTSIVTTLYFVEADGLNQGQHISESC